MDVCQSHHQPAVNSMAMFAMTNLPKLELKMFSGDSCLSYLRFKLEFNRIFPPETVNAAQRYQYLVSYTSGVANEIVRSYEMNDLETALRRAFRKLDERWCDDLKLSDELSVALEDYPEISKPDPEQIQDFHIKLIRHRNLIEKLPNSVDFNTPSQLMKLIRKLPVKMREAYRDHACNIRENQDRNANFDDLIKFV